MNLDVLMLSRDEGKGAQGEEGVIANSEACDVSPQSRVQNRSGKGWNTKVGWDQIFKDQ